MNMKKTNDNNNWPGNCIKAYKKQICPNRKTSLDYKDPPPKLAISSNSWPIAYLPIMWEILPERLKKRNLLIAGSPWIISGKKRKKRKGCCKEIRGNNDLIYTHTHIYMYYYYHNYYYYPLDHT